MQKISYHGGHSGELCDHAKDNKELIIQSYIRQEFTHVGIIEHLPPDEDRFLYPDEVELKHDAALLSQRFEKYFDETVPSLKTKYGAQINLLFGFETEFYGKQKSARIEKAIKRYEPEIIVASVHHVDDIPIDFEQQSYQEAVEQCGGLDMLYLRYYQHQLELIKLLSAYSSKIPVVLGHMDLIKIFSKDHKHSLLVASQIEKNIKAAVDAGIVFEINARGFKKGLGEPYPSLEIIEEVLRHGGRFTLGDDSHAADEPGLFYAEVEEWIKNMVKEIAVVEKSANNSYQWVNLPLEGT